jgi:hypothetical protein
MKNKLIPILLILSSFLLFSCSLTNAIFGGGSTEPTTTEEAPAPDESMMTEATEAPTLAETVPAATEASGLQPDTQSNCYNPFFPIVEGASWTYQFVDTKETYSNDVSNVNQDSFTLTQTFYTTEGNEDLVLTADWYCSSDGLLQGNFAQLDMLNQSGSEGGPEMSFETIKWEGETLPSPDLMQVGYEWESTYTLKGDVNMQGIETTADATVTIKYMVGAIEEVTTPAGTFANAYRVDSDGNIDIEMSMSGATVPINAVGFSSSSWYVENVGLVKTANTFSSFESGMALMESNMIN